MKRNDKLTIDLLIFFLLDEGVQIVETDIGGMFICIFIFVELALYLFDALVVELG
jgi:hypothetical protein